MRLKVNLFFMVFGLFFLTMPMQARIDSYNSTILTPDSTELLISFQPNNAEQIEQLKVALSKQVGWTYYGFCTQHGVALVKTNEVPEQIHNILMTISKQEDLKSLKLKQFGFGDIINFCGFSANLLDVIYKKQSKNE
jgi:hypothetical protein